MAWTCNTAKEQLISSHDRHLQDKHTTSLRHSTTTHTRTRRPSSPLRAPATQHQEKLAAAATATCIEHLQCKHTTSLQHSTHTVSAPRCPCNTAHSNKSGSCGNVAPPPAHQRDCLHKENAGIWKCANYFAQHVPNSNSPACSRYLDIYHGAGAVVRRLGQSRWHQKEQRTGDCTTTGQVTRARDRRHVAIADSGRAIQDAWRHRKGALLEQGKLRPSERLCRTYLWVKITQWACSLEPSNVFLLLLSVLFQLHCQPWSEENSVSWIAPQYAIGGYVARCGHGAFGRIALFRSAGLDSPHSTMLGTS